MTAEERKRFSVDSIVNNNRFWADLEDVMKVLKPIVDAQAKSESNSCSLADIVIALKRIYESLNGQRHLFEHPNSN